MSEPSRGLRHFLPICPIGLISPISPITPITPITPLIKKKCNNSSSPIGSTSSPLF